MGYPPAPVVPLPLLIVKLFAWFWLAFLLFFAIPFPCILYFASDWPRVLAQPSTPAWALTLLALSLGLWLHLLYAYLDTLLLMPGRALHRVRHLLAHGVRREALIERAAPTGVEVKGWPQLSLTLAFDNLSGTPIRDTVLIVDRKPAQRRFESGRTVPLRLSTTPGAAPNLVLEDAEPALDRASLWRRAAGALLLVVLVGAAYVLAWRLQNRGMGWTFLSFNHPLLMSALVLNGYVLALRVILRVIRRNATDETLKYRGLRARARVLDVRQTGTTLNEQPQVEFRVAFEDASGNPHEATMRRFVSLLDVGQLPRDTVSVLYDPQHPARADLELP